MQLSRLVLVDNSLEQNLMGQAEREYVLLLPIALFKRSPFRNLQTFGRQVPGYLHSKVFATRTAGLLVPNCCVFSFD